MISSRSCRLTFDKLARQGLLTAERSGQKTGDLPQVARHWLLRAVFGAGMIAIAAFAAGLAVFTAQLDRIEPRAIGEADGAVALTGGVDRISDAVNLLARGHVGRLLITGVNQTTSGAEIAKLTPKFGDLFGCCIDLGYDALNTRGNALEARRWAHGRGMHSLIVVTSAYHMPRALIEFSSVLPEIELIPFSVVPERLRDGRWWADPQLTRILAVEYAKYLRAALRVKLFGPAERATGKTMTAQKS